MTIPDEHVLPCEFVVGHIRYGKGVKLETVRKACERWHAIAVAAYGQSFSELTPEAAKLLNTAYALTKGEG